MHYIVRVRQEIYVPVYDVESNTEAITKAIKINFQLNRRNYHDRGQRQIH